MPALLSIIIPTRNEVDHLQEAVSSILAGTQDVPVEVLICDGASTDGTSELAKHLAETDPRIRYIQNPAIFAPHGMNAGLRAAKGDHIFVVSAHASYSDNYFQTLSEAVERLGAACAGGVLRTEVKAGTPAAAAIRAVLGDPFGVGNAYFRIGLDNPRQVDTVAYGCYPRWVFDAVGGYDERLIRNQDIELNKRIIAGGGAIWLLPQATATYFARPTLGAFLANQFSNGRWNLLTVVHTRSWSSISLRHLIPGCFAMSLVLPALGAIWNPWWGLPALLVLAVYLPLAIWRGIVLKLQGARLPYTVVTLFLLHLVYGLGTALGAVQALGLYIRGRTTPTRLT